MVLEIVLGSWSTKLLGLAKPDEFLEFFSSLGLGMLFFFAGYEIDFERIRGSPLKLAAIGWLISLALAYSLGGLLALSGLVLSLLFTGSALATTAIGTLIPILSDAGELRTRFGSYLLAAGAMGEFGPILLITFVFSTQSALDNALIIWSASRPGSAAVVGVRGLRPLGSDETHPETSTSWPPIRRGRVRLASLAAVAGLDLLRGGFVPVIVRLASRTRGRVSVSPALATLLSFFFLGVRSQVDLSALTEDRIRHSSCRSSWRCSSSSAAYPRCCSTGASSTAKRASRWPSSRPPSCRSWWRSRPSPSTRATCVPPPRPRWWARRSSRPRSSRWSLPCGGSGAG